MEDAMIVNKGAVDRGFMHGRVIKTEVVDLSDDRNRTKQRFGSCLLPHPHACAASVEKWG